LPLRSVDDVVQVAALFVPEALLKCRYGSLPISLALIGVRCLAEQTGEGFSDTQGVHPQGLNLYRFAMPRCDNPVTDLGIHPGQLGAGNSPGDQAVFIHSNPVTCAVPIAIENLFDGRSGRAADTGVILGRRSSDQWHG